MNRVDPFGLQEGGESYPYFDPNHYDPYDRSRAFKVLNPVQLKQARDDFEVTSNAVIITSSAASPDPTDLLGLAGIWGLSKLLGRVKAARYVRANNYVDKGECGDVLVGVYNHPHAHAMISVQDDLLNVHSVSRGSLGAGAGPELLKIALENSSMAPVKRAILHEIRETATVKALESGVSPLITRVYRLVRGPLKSVGKSPTNVRITRSGGVTNMEMDLR